ncbi:PDDEXK family nuclease [Geomonas edaphica]|uniref:hypothetical protein n=1 Tax=Geomonas edaphica TaxID=2570226 RepID=UPI0018E0B1D0|nr:hypothetical protein [Geomonas edaphica]
MPIELGIWRLGATPQKVVFSSIDSEARLEQTLCKDISILSPSLMLIGQQVPTAYGTFIDMLAMDRDGNLTVIELKRNKTPREVTAQALDYASWVKNLSYTDIATIFADKNNGKALEVAFAEKFSTPPPEKVNERHTLVVVASELDAATERIINYLCTNYGVPINAVFFRYFKDGDSEFLTRTWLLDPHAAEENILPPHGTETWNGRDCYVSFGEGEHRNWEDACRYGFISGGQGRWYSQSLNLLAPGMRVFACIPGSGYVGYGVVTETMVPVTNFTVSINGQEMQILNAPLVAPNMADNSSNSDLCEYLVRVEWKQVKPRNNAYWEQGMFANQNTACRLRNRFTLEKLYQYFKLED